MSLFLIHIHFERAPFVVERAYKAVDANDAMDQALAQFPHAAGCGHVPGHEFKIRG